MTESTVSVKIPSVEQLIAAIGQPKLKISMAGAATVIAGEVRKRWLSGRGANNEGLESEQRINPTWKKQKEASGKKGKIDFMYSGDFAISFIPRRQTDTEVVIGFGGFSRGIKYIPLTPGYKSSAKKKPKSVSNLKISRGLAYYRPKAFLPDDTLKIKGIKAFNESLKRLVKFTK